MRSEENEEVKIKSVENEEVEMHSALSTLHSALNSYSAHFPHFAFLTLCFFHTLYFPHSSLHIFHQTCLMVMHSLNIAVVSLGQIHDLRGVLEIQTANGGPQ